MLFCRFKLGFFWKSKSMQCSITVCCFKGRMAHSTTEVLFCWKKCHCWKTCYFWTYPGQCQPSGELGEPTALSAGLCTPQKRSKQLLCDTYGFVTQTPSLHNTCTAVVSPRTHSNPNSIRDIMLCCNVAEKWCWLVARKVCKRMKSSVALTMMENITSFFISSVILMATAFISPVGLTWAPS